MSNSYRIRTQPGVDKSIKILIDQEFEYLEILSLKLLQSQIYTRQCSDYGVVVGRVSVNNGFGLPNAKVSIFIPLDSTDELDPVISDLYPYKTLSELNDDGYRYNLLPYKQSHSGHVPTGTFFDKLDVLVDPTLIEVYDKYYKYTTITNSSGDYMIFGVPTGSQTIVMDVDLSDIGEFSLSPQDLIRMGVATPNQVAGTKFKSSKNLRELPQLININKIIQVEPLWGQPEICNLGITRTDFDLSGESNIDIRPTAIFMGSIISTNDSDSIKANCTVKSNSGYLCDMTTGPGEILAIRQTIQQDSYGRPILETVDLDEGGQVIDENGTWMVDVPMNMDYVTTNEFGEQVLSNDPNIGVPTRGKYRFKVKWNQSPSLSESIKRGYFLVPNIREYGWTGTSLNDPFQIKDTSTEYTSYQLAMKSYTFSLDWAEYGYTGSSMNSNAVIGRQMIQDAIDCKDTFYDMRYNKVYTVSQLLDKYRNGYSNDRFTGVKNILDSSCQSENYKFPTNDSNMRYDIIYILFSLLMMVFRPILYVLVLVMHVLFFILELLKSYLAFGLAGWASFAAYNSFTAASVSAPAFGLTATNIAAGVAYLALGVTVVFVRDELKKVDLKGINLPLLTYPDCEMCDCAATGVTPGNAPGDKNALANKNRRIPCSTITSDLTPMNDLTSDIQISQLGTPIYDYPFFDDESYKTVAFMQIFAGKQYIDRADFSIGTSSLVTAKYSITNDEGEDKNYTDYFFTSSLTLAERINLFNTKAKYFDNSPNNPGGGVNRIRTTFGINSNLGKSHLDNTIVIIGDINSLRNYTPGQLISFQNPNLTKDLNTTNAITNQYGNNAITGTSATTTTITVNFAKTDGSGNSGVTYNNIVQTGDSVYHKFPIDIEYFQVITGMTYGNFSANCSNDIINSLNSRYLSNDMRVIEITGQHSYKDNCQIAHMVSPITKVDDYKNLSVIILNRGVDPYSSKIDVQYDLSVLFGKNFGDTSSIIKGNYRMNIPVNGKFLNVSHSKTNLVTNTAIDTYSNQPLYFNSFYYTPSNQFSAFTSNLHSYYSALDKSNETFRPTGNKSEELKNVSYTTGVNSINGVAVIPTNTCAKEAYIEVISDGCFNYNPTGNTTTSSRNRGYFPSEIVEGGSMEWIKGGPPSRISGYSCCEYYKNPTKDISAIYFSPIYNTTGNTLNYNLGSGNQIVMRSDRLPSSTVVDETNCNGFLLQKNRNFQIYNIPDTGIVGIVLTGSTLPSMTVGIADNTADNKTNKILESTSCGGSVPLECYVNDGNGNVTISDSNSCRTYKNEKIFSNGCYILVTTVFLSLGKDWSLLTEWVSRTSINFGACRNVWSHTFSNNWVNGTLYAYSFSNNVTYNSLNKPSSDYCTDTLILHPTNNFYYRSSPYKSSTDSFIGRDRPKANSAFSDILGPYGDNFENLQNPTTIMDLGPRNNYLQELVMSDEFDGYVANRLNSTTYGDVTEILNILILSRLMNKNFIEKMVELFVGSNILVYFSRSKDKVDGDYSQLISINSELGVAPFQASNYPDNPSPMQSPIYISGFDDDNSVIGIFFSSDTRVRDFITPKRSIINSQLPVGNECAFNNFTVFSQKVPFYQWEIKGESTIFGNEENGWDTKPFSDSSFFSYNYQSLDRLNSDSRYFRPTNNSKSEYTKGYIYAVSGNGSIDESYVNWSQNTPEKVKSITTGAPFYFYFGLKKGKSAYDRFTTKWLDTTITTD
jgi:hypothetical protein